MKPFSLLVFAALVVKTVASVDGECQGQVFEFENETRCLTVVACSDDDPYAYFDSDSNSCVCSGGMSMDSTTGRCQCSGPHVTQQDGSCMCMDSFVPTSEEGEPLTCGCVGTIEIDGVCRDCGHLEQPDMKQESCVCKEFASRATDADPCKCIDGFVEDKGRCICAAPRTLDRVSRTCTCPSGSIYDEGTDSCILKCDGGLQTENDGHCTCVTNAFDANEEDDILECKCEDGFVPSDNECKPRQECDGDLQTENDGHCTCVTNAFDANEKDDILECKCEDGFVPSDNECKPRQECDGDLQTENDGHCTCVTNAFDANEEDDNLECKCEDGFVPSDNECKPRQECDGDLQTENDGHCTCVTNAFDANEEDDILECKCEDGFVPSDNECKPRQECDGDLQTENDGHCTCVTNAFDANEKDDILECKCEDGFVPSDNECKPRQECDGDLQTENDGHCTCVTNAFDANEKDDILECKCEDGFVPSDNECKLRQKCDGDLQTENDGHCTCVTNAFDANEKDDILECKCEDGFVPSDNECKPRQECDGDLQTENDGHCTCVTNAFDANEKDDILECKCEDGFVPSDNECKPRQECDGDLQTEKDGHCTCVTNAFDANEKDDILECKCEDGFVPSDNECKLRQECDGDLQIRDRDGQCKCMPGAENVSDGEGNPECRCRAGYIVKDGVCVLNHDEECGALSYFDEKRDQCFCVPNAVRAGSTSVSEDFVSSEQTAAGSLASCVCLPGFREENSRCVSEVTCGKFMRVGRDNKCHCVEHSVPSSSADSCMCEEGYSERFAGVCSPQCSKPNTVFVNGHCQLQCGDGEVVWRDRCAPLCKSVERRDEVTGECQKVECEDGQELIAHGEGATQRLICLHKCPEGQTRNSKLVCERIGGQILPEVFSTTGSSGVEVLLRDGANSASYSLYLGDQLPPSDFVLQIRSVVVGGEGVAVTPSEFSLTSAQKKQDIEVIISDVSSAKMLRIIHEISMGGTKLRPVVVPVFLRRPTLSLRGVGVVEPGHAYRVSSLAEDVDREGMFLEWSVTPSSVKWARVHDNTAIELKTIPSSLDQVIVTAELVNEDDEVVASATHRIKVLRKLEMEIMGEGSIVYQGFFYPILFHNIEQQHFEVMRAFLVPKDERRDSNGRSIRLNVWPGAETTFQWAVEPQLPVGEYKLSAVIRLATSENEKRDLTVVSSTFSVHAPLHLACQSSCSDKGVQHKFTCDLVAGAKPFFPSSAQAATLRGLASSIAPIPMEFWAKDFVHGNEDDVLQACRRFNLERPECDSPVCSQPQWSAGPFSHCDAECGKTGKRVRTVRCIGGSDESSCDVTLKPAVEEPCRKPQSECYKYEWRVDRENFCSKQTSCQEVYPRPVCMMVPIDSSSTLSMAQVSPNFCQGSRVKPVACETPDVCATLEDLSNDRPEYEWVAGPWKSGDCPTDCSMGEDTSSKASRDVACALVVKDDESGRRRKEIVPDEECDSLERKPATTRPCPPRPRCVRGSWRPESVSECRKSGEVDETTCLAKGVREISYECVLADGTVSSEPEVHCGPVDKLPMRRPCVFKDTECAPECAPECGTNQFCANDNGQAICKCKPGFVGESCDQRVCSEDEISYTTPKGTFCCSNEVGFDREQSVPVCCPDDAPVRSKHGQCCAAVNACGECADVTATDAQPSIDGTVCCTNGASADGFCCPDGTKRDSCGVCGGTGTCSGTLFMDYLGSTLTEEELQAYFNGSDPYALDLFYASTADKLAELLQFTGDDRRRLNIQAVASEEDGNRRLLDVQEVLRRLADGTDVAMEVNIAEGDSGYNDEEVVSKLSDEPSFAVNGVERNGQCNNGICEVGEACVPGATSCCSVDCPTVWLSCPTLDGQECGGPSRGICSHTTGQCSCHSSLGFEGDNCGLCMEGFVFDSTSGTCVADVSSVTMSFLVTAEVQSGNTEGASPADGDSSTGGGGAGDGGNESDGDGMGIYIGAAVGGIAVIAVVVGVVVIKKRRSQPRRSSADSPSERDLIDTSNPMRSNVSGPMTDWTMKQRI